MGSSYPVDVRYTLDGVAFLLQVPRTTVNRWANGYTKKTKYGQTEHKGVLSANREDPLLFNFQELIELWFVKQLTRPKGKSDQKAYHKELGEIVAIADNLRDVLGDYPLARAELRAVGRQLVTDKLSDQSNLFLNPQLMQNLLDFADELVKDLDFDEDSGMAIRWHPDPDNELVLVDSHRRFGRPIVPSGVTTETIYGRFRAEGDIESTAEWFQIPPDEVRAAVKFQEDWASKTAA